MTGGLDDPREGPDTRASGGAVVRTRAELARARDAMPGRVAVVPTMGALHEGHLALVDRARDLADHVVVTVFVNPLQFGPAEDLAAYPRDLDRDLGLLSGRGVGTVFAPPAPEVYPLGAPHVGVDPGPAGRVLEGASRPGHFAGVLTVVTVLLHLVRPHVAVFGEKDAQQLALVRRMVADLALPVAVEGVPTVRAADGLALSSRNAYLSPEDRRRAAALPAALRTAGEAAGARGAWSGRAAARAVLDAAEGVDPDYAELVRPDTFEVLDEASAGAGPALLVLAARVAGTRLVDNALLPGPALTA